MSDIKKVIKMDYFSIKPYITIKNLIIMVSLSIFYSYIGKNPVLVFSMPILFAIIFSGYPFLVGDDAGIDSLYRIFGIKSDDVVYGRYVSAFLLSLISVIIGFILFFISSLILNNNVILSKSIMEHICISIFAVMFVVLLQYPFYFKYGYTKGKTLAMFPFMFFGICVFLLSFLKKEILENLFEIKYNNDLFIMLKVAGLVLFCILVVVSIVISKRIYRKRDF